MAVPAGAIDGEACCVHDGISPFSCHGAFPDNLGRLLELEFARLQIHAALAALGQALRAMGVLPSGVLHNPAFQEVRP